MRSRARDADSAAVAPLDAMPLPQQQQQPAASGALDSTDVLPPTSVSPPAMDLTLPPPAPLHSHHTPLDAERASGQQVTLQQPPQQAPAALAGVQMYPRAVATHAEVVADAALFNTTLNDLYAELGIKVQKVMKLGGQELNLHLLYQRVCERGGALQVIREKHWRDVGDAFHLPKTITSVSFVLKRGYMMYLWDYEQVFFMGRGGQPRVPAPVSRYTKDSGPAAMAPAAAPGSAPAVAAGSESEPSAAPGTCSGRQDWCAMDHTSAAPLAPQAALQPVAPPGDALAAPFPLAPPQLLTLVAMPTPGSALPAVGQTGTFQVSAALGGGTVSITGLVANTPFVGVLSNPATSASPLPQAAPSQAPAMSGSRGAEAPPEAAKAKRARACTSSATADSADARAAQGEEDAEDERVALPDTVSSLLSRLTLGGDRAWLGASTQLTPGGRSAATWMELDAHKRSVVQAAVRADEERFRAEQALRDAQIAADAARRRRREAMQAAEGTLLRSSAGLALHRRGMHGCGVSAPAGLPDPLLGSHSSSPSTRIGAGSACGHVVDTPRTSAAPPLHPFAAPLHAAHGAHAGATRPPLHEQGARHDAAAAAPPHAAACDDPLMTRIAISGMSGSLPGSLERDHYLHGAAYQVESQAQVSFALRGPVASPNVNARPLDPSRHNVYATDAGDTPVMTRAWAAGALDATAAPHIAGESSALHAMDDVAPGELEPDSHLLEPVLDNAYMEELLTGKDEGIWALQDDLMLEEPP